MKIFFAYDYPLSGTESVAKAMAKGLLAMGHEVTTMAVRRGLPEGFDKSLRDFDVAHFWNKNSFGDFLKEIRVPFGFTSHGFGGQGQVQKVCQEHYLNYFKATNPYWMHVMDTFTLQILAREGIYPFYTPQCITQEGFTRLPYPKEISIGSIGHDGDGYKRHAMIQGAATRLKVPFIGLNSSDGETDKVGVISLYERMAIYVDACFGACGPVPPQEALLCGRPVIVTRIHTMLDTVMNGVNGLFYDGSQDDLVKKTHMMLDNYNAFYEGTKRTKLLSNIEAATLFVEGIENSL